MTNLQRSHAKHLLQVRRFQHRFRAAITKDFPLIDDHHLIGKGLHQLEIVQHFYRGYLFFMDQRQQLMSGQRIEMVSGFIKQ
ncbi:hypothetical protein D3C71_2026610 [compost metagenome]